MRAEASGHGPLSLAWRITLVVVASLALILALFAAGVGWSIRRHFAQMDVTEMAAVGRLLRPVLEDSQQPQDTLPERLAHAVAGHHGVLFAVRTGSGRPVYGTAPEELWQLAAPRTASRRLEPQALREAEIGGHGYRTALIARGPYQVLLAVDTGFHAQYLRGLWRSMAIAAAASLGLVIVAVWLAVRWGHAPLRRLSEDLHEVGSSRLDLRLDPCAAPAELRGLVSDFNAVLDRLEAGFRRLSQFSADIAHELRTPITNLSTQLQVELAKPREPERYREALYGSLEELDRLAKMVADMLFLAQAEHGALLHQPAPFDMTAEVRDLFEYFEALAEERQVDLLLEGERTTVWGDRLMWRRALSNLLSNALRYTPPGRAVTVRLRQAAAGTTIDVENPGETVPAAHLPHLFERFYRADPARRHTGEGAGLGLAIVKSIVLAHGGSIDVTSAQGRTRFTISLPPAPADLSQAGQRPQPG